MNWAEKGDLRPRLKPLVDAKAPLLKSGVPHEPAESVVQQCLPPARASRAPAGVPMGSGTKLCKNREQVCANQQQRERTAWFPVPIEHNGCYALA
ncbi:hypothetical protein CBM2585_A130001 [Cupriavidus taiwanensis]|nr:hypothetical protein CBM2585_A130001 [Cupriavidus taiwanensis]